MANSVNIKLAGEQQSLDINDVFHKLQYSDGIGVFDFDGVVISKSEELVYQLPEYPGERKKLKEICREINYPSVEYNTKYLRHIVFQYGLERLHIPCEKGPLTPLLKLLKRIDRPFYIITARSAAPAVRRALAYLQDEKIEPTEIFFVGRVGKGRQINLIKSDFGSDKILYFDDSRRHFVNAGRMKEKEISSYHVEWADSELQQASELYRGVINRAF